MKFKTYNLADDTLDHSWAIVSISDDLYVTGSWLKICCLLDDEKKETAAADPVKIFREELKPAI